MSAPPEAGATDGEIRHHRGREWRWSADHGAWLPTKPKPFEAVRSEAGATLIYVKYLDDWVDALAFPTPAEHGYGSSVAGPVVRESVIISVEPDDD